jgi:hypothetical protein
MRRAPLLTAFIAGALIAVFFTSAFKKITLVAEEEHPKERYVGVEEGTAKAASARAIKASDEITRAVENSHSGRAPIGGIGSKRHQITHYAWAAWHIAEQNKRLYGQDTTWWCEIGFGSGQSTAALLATHPSIKTLTFDLFPQRGGAGMGSWKADILFAQQEAALKAIDRLFPGRSSRVAGGSNDTVPVYPSQHPNFKCDILSVDGWHGSPAVYWDIMHMMPLARPGAMLLLDDMERSPMKADLLRTHQEGKITRPLCKKSGFMTHEWCVARYAVPFSQGR